MKPLTLAEHRARIDHINLAEKNNKKYYDFSHSIFYSYRN